MSDTANHIKLDMTPERKHRWSRVSSKIMDILEKETKPIESMAILDLLRDTINQRYFLGDYKGSHLISTSKRIAESICPGCQTKLDAYSDEAGNTAEPGDLTVCSTCGEILLFTQQMTVERPNPTQLEVIRYRRKSHGYRRGHQECAQRAGITHGNFETTSGQERVGVSYRENKGEATGCRSSKRRDLLSSSASRASFSSMQSARERSGSVSNRISRAISFQKRLRLASSIKSGVHRGFASKVTGCAWICQSARGHRLRGRTR